MLEQRSWTVLAGGTDIFPSLVGRALPDAVLDITALEAMRGVEMTKAGVRIGGLTPWSAIIKAELPPAFDGLKLAAREIGSLQIQNRATIAGNLCNASPAADGVPPLLSLDAEVELTSLSGSRFMPVAKFIAGNRHTTLAPGELLTAIHIAKPATTGFSHFLKLGTRRYLVISIAMAAARITFDEADRVADAAIAIGACSEIATRLGALEAALVGCPRHNLADTCFRSKIGAALTPISDIRATAEYRLVAAQELVHRAIAHIVAVAGKGCHV